MRRRDVFSLLAAAGLASPRQACAQDRASLSMQAAYINDAEFLGYYVALDEGQYRRAGIDLRYIPGGPDVIPEGALIARTAEVAPTEPDTAIRTIVRDDSPFVIIGAQFQKSPMGVISLSRSPIRSPADLAGRTLSVTAVSLTLIRHFLAFNGLGPRDVRIVPDVASDPMQLLRAPFKTML